MSQRITLEKLFDEFWSGSLVQGTTKRACRSAWQWLKKLKGPQCQAEEVTSDDIVRFQLYLRDEAMNRFGQHFPAKSIFGYTTSLGEVFKYAAKHAYVVSNPVRALDKTDRIKPPQKAVHVYSDDELADLLDTVRSNPDQGVEALKWSDPTASLRWTGFILCGLHLMREGEIWNLRWQDIDLEGGNLKVQSRTDKAGQWWTWDAKTCNERELPMNDELWAVMSRLKEVAPWTYPFLVRVACEAKVRQIGRLKETQRKYPYNGFHRQFHRILAATNKRRRQNEKPPIEAGKFHTFRKNGVTHLTEEGVPEVHIQKIVGHATDRLTKEVYTYVNERKAMGLSRDAFNRYSFSK